MAWTNVLNKHIEQTSWLLNKRLEQTSWTNVLNKHLEQTSWTNITYTCYVVKNLWNSYLFLLESFLNLGEILVSNGSRAVPKGAWRCCKSFGTIWDQFSSTFTHYNSTFSWKIKAAILSKWRFLVIFSESFLPLFRRNSASKCMKRGAKQRLAVL